MVARDKHSRLICSTMPPRVPGSMVLKAAAAAAPGAAPAKASWNTTGGICAGGAPCRQVKNKYTRRVIEAERAGKPFAEIEEMTIGSLRRAVQTGDKDNGSFMCGQIGGMVNEIRPCKEVIETMFKAADELLHHKYESLY